MSQMSLKPEPQYATIWRTIKILKHFTLLQLHQNLLMTHDVQANYLRRYVGALVRYGYLAKHGKQFSVLKVDCMTPQPKDLKGI
ncbi:hypothetical protein [Wielerella bovis]|uniref:hypothetical protein n=1 Tax=Wielerella bovis TaxID=2917790 RepID=UPI00201A0FBC|nr:hypothetical protein [Wielerella bovis]MCG7655907.1 hypothetical protein [Wielerella bovis]MCG7656895.1 hypothetical protein [Wielerella bovis]MCG7658096.1 hypothetical protein [Wielerella bovis]MCG7658176.1 hypothetical protein [Wielerella bovis]MCG7659118.1 hypothetical protein [Wielerella bovis]